MAINDVIRLQNSLKGLETVEYMRKMNLEAMSPQNRISRICQQYADLLSAIVKTPPDPFKSLSASFQAVAQAGAEQQKILGSFAIGAVPEIAKTIRSINEPMGLVDINATLNQASEIFRKMAESATSPLTNSTETAAEVFRRFNETVTFAGTNINQTVGEAFLRAREFLPEEEQEKLDDIVLKQIPKEGIWTPSNILSIISILTALFFNLMMFLPDKQVEELCEQNATIIDQQAQIIEMQKQENNKLVDTLTFLTEAIEGLTEQVQTLGEQEDEAGEAGDPNKQDAGQDALEQDSDTDECQ